MINKTNYLNSRLWLIVINVSECIVRNKIVRKLIEIKNERLRFKK